MGPFDSNSDTSEEGSENLSYTPDYTSAKSAVLSGLAEVDSLISGSELQKAESRLDDVESRLDLLAERFSDQSKIDEINGLYQSVKKQRRKIQQKQENEQQYREEESAVLSGLAEVDSLISGSELQKAESRLDDVESRLDLLAERFSDQSKIDEINGLYQSVKKQRRKIQQKQENEQQYREEESAVLSGLAEVDSLISDSELREAQNVLDDLESRLDSLTKEFSNKKGSNRVDEIRKSMSEKREEIKQEVEDQKHKGKFREEIRSIRSELSEVDSLALDADFQQAKQLLNAANSDIVQLRQEFKQSKFGGFESEIQQLEKWSDNQLSKPNVLGQLREMDPYEFEELVAKIWETQGWDAEVTSGSTDKGVDIVATKEDTFEKRRHLIQVKRHGENSTVGSKEIQRYASLYQRDEQVDTVFVVTSNQFTKEAKEVSERRDVSIVNGDKLYEMLTNT